MTQPAAGDTQAHADALPIIIVDARHAMRVHDGSGTPYLQKAGAGLVLDARQIVFSDPQRLGRTPNVVRVLYETSEYSSLWPQRSTAPVSLDASSMKLVRGLPFSGFEAGKRAAIGIGYETPNEQTGQVDFREFWAGWVIFN
jgi:hypothetical protein